MRVKRKGELEYFIGRRYGDFNRLLKNLRTELPGKVLPPMPKKNKQSSTASNIINSVKGKDDDDDMSSLSSVSTMSTMGTESSMKGLTIKNNRLSTSSALSIGRSPSRSSFDGRPPNPGTPNVEVKIKRVCPYTVANIR